jgi:4-hydroxythreonine-4-phosphate dehydrogenase
MNTLVFTCGDINGIGPEICFKTINSLYEKQQHKIILAIPSNVFETTSSIIHPSFSYKIVKDMPLKINPEYITVIDIGKCKEIIGNPTKESGHAAFVALLKAFELTSQKIADAMITAPISKSAFKLDKKNFPGQTELLAKLSNSKKYLMVFLSDELICALTTIHEPIKNISRLLTTPVIKNALQILHNTLINDLGIKSPKIAALGLNPHAGENGNIGIEEKKVIKPLIKSMKKILVDGPFVPDAYFGNKKFKEYDATLGMYHDQVLIPFKLLNFNVGVNYTAGLPVIRTSPDHGTGYDIAGKGIADSRSMQEAVKWADKIIMNRRLSKRAG